MQLQGWMRLEPAKKQQDNDYHQHNAHYSTGRVAPFSAVRPCWDDPEQHQYQHDKKNCTQTHVLTPGGAPASQRALLYLNALVGDCLFRRSAVVMLF